MLTNLWALEGGCRDKDWVSRARLLRFNCVIAGALCQPHKQVAIFAPCIFCLITVNVLGRRVHIFPYRSFIYAAKVNWVCCFLGHLCFTFTPGSSPVYCFCLSQEKKSTARMLMPVSQFWFLNIAQLLFPPFSWKLSKLRTIEFHSLFPWLLFTSSWFETLNEYMCSKHIWKSAESILRRFWWSVDCTGLCAENCVQYKGEFAIAANHTYCTCKRIKSGLSRDLLFYSSIGTSATREFPLLSGKRSWRWQYIGGRRRGSKKTVKSDWLTSKSPIPLFIWTLPSHSAWLPARETVLLFLRSFFPISLHALFLPHSLWFLSSMLCFCVSWSTFLFPLMVPP